MKLKIASLICNMFSRVDVHLATIFFRLKPMKSRNCQTLLSTRIAIFFLAFYLQATNHKYLLITSFRLNICFLPLSEK